MASGQVPPAWKLPSGPWAQLLAPATTYPTPHPLQVEAEVRFMDWGGCTLKALLQHQLGVWESSVETPTPHGLGPDLLQGFSPGKSAPAASSKALGLLTFGGLSRSWWKSRSRGSMPCRMPLLTANGPSGPCEQGSTTLSVLCMRTADGTSGRTCTPPTSLSSSS